MSGIPGQFLSGRKPTFKVTVSNQRRKSKTYGEYVIPNIQLAGAWITKKAGLQIGDVCTITCEDGRMILTKKLND